MEATTFTVSDEPDVVEESSEQAVSPPIPVRSPVVTMNASADRRLFFIARMSPNELLMKYDVNWFS